MTRSFRLGLFVCLAAAVGLHLRPCLATLVMGGEEGCVPPAAVASAGVRGGASADGSIGTAERGALNTDSTAHIAAALAGRLSEGVGGATVMPAAVMPANMTVSSQGTQALAALAAAARRERPSARPALSEMARGVQFIGFRTAAVEGAGR